MNANYNYKNTEKIMQQIKFLLQSQPEFTDEEIMVALSGGLLYMAGFGGEIKQSVIKECKTLAELLEKGTIDGEAANPDLVKNFGPNAKPIY